MKKIYWNKKLGLWCWNTKARGSVLLEELKKWVPDGNLKYDSFTLYKQENEEELEDPEYFLVTRYRRENSNSNIRKLSKETALELKEEADLNYIITNYR